MSLVRHQKYECTYVLEKLAFPCPICGKDFTRNYLLERHLSYMHCVTKSDVLKKGVQLTRIPRFPASSDTGEPGSSGNWGRSASRPFWCELCHVKSYARRESLYRHQKYECTNVLEKPVFPCSVCGKEFTRKCNLELHVFRLHAASTASAATPEVTDEITL
nr:PREDICTED: gastrula zinc finger protein XlCGF26.1-like [Bemisia tabaci]